MIYVAYAFGTLIGLLALLLVVGRTRQALYRRALRDAIAKYVASRGGTVEFHEDETMTVSGPRGGGRETLTTLLIMCRPGENERWETSIGFTLRKYIPDAFDDAFAKSARERLEKARGAIDALSEAELRDRLRVRVCSKRDPADGLVTCARALGERFEVRVVLEGFDVHGLSESARARLTESDDALHEQAIESTLVEPPSLEASAASLVWLCRPAVVFGDTPMLVACVGDEIVWREIGPAITERDVASITSRTLQSGPMKGVLFAWDGNALSEIGVMTHTIKGPSTPDFTLSLPPAIAVLLGLATANGKVGVRV